MGILAPVVDDVVDEVGLAGLVNLWVAIVVVRKQAADDRVKASRLIADAVSDVYENLGMPLPDGGERINRPSVTTQTSNLMLKRMDSFYYAKENVDARSAFDRAGRSCSRRR